MLSHTEWWLFHLRLSPVTFNFIGTVSLFVHKFLRVIHCSVCIAMLFEIAVRFPAVGYYNCSWFNPLFYQGQQSCFVSFVDCHHKTFPTLLLDSSKNPLSFDVMSSMLFSLSKFAFINLDNLSFSAYFLTAITNLSAKAVPVYACTTY